MLLMFAPTKTTQLFKSDAPRSWFKLACVKEREFVDVLCSTASVVNSPPLDVGFSSKWCEPEESEFGCFISTGRWSRKMLVKFYGTPFSSCRVNLRLECSLVAIFSPLLRLRLTFINPNKHFAAILERMLLYFHVSPKQLAAFIFGPKAEMEGQKPPHGSLEGYRTEHTKLATFKDVCLLLYLSPRGWRLACSPCRLSGLTLSS